ncbi:MAG: precorrin-6y C5,15-methyltransferase (decarboxylating) subunit CbiE [Pseudomonadota bacterium]
MSAWLHVVGIGADGLEGITQHNQELVLSAEVLVGSPRHLDFAPDHGQMRIAWESPLADTFSHIEAHRSQTCVVLASGDPLWFGVATQLIGQFGADEVAIYPAVSSIQLACSRLGWSVQDTIIVSLHGRPLQSLRQHLDHGRNLLVLSGPDSQASHVADFLQADGYPRAKITVLERLGAESERISVFDRQPHDPLAILAIESGRPSGARLRPWSGMPDDAFEHDGKITKRELRAMAIAKLAQAPGGVLWDIGAGSGAMAIEWLLSGAGSNACALECDSARVGTIKRNAARFGVHLAICQGTAPGAFDPLLRPDAIFVGGGLSDSRLLAECIHHLPANGRLVAHAVTLESEKTLLDAHQRYGGELIRIGIDRASPVGHYHGWRPSMPVLQYALTKS